MGVKGFSKTGSVSESSISEPEGHNLLYDTLGQYTEGNPLVVNTGTRKDGYISIGKAIKLPVDLGNVFYLLCKSSSTWAPVHYASSATGEQVGQVTIWYYLRKDANDTNIETWDSAVCYHSNNWLSKGIWRTTIDVSTYKSLNIRINNYSDGNTSVTSKFWDFKLIPAKYFLGGTKKSAIYSGLLSSDNFIEY